MIDLFAFLRMVIAFAANFKMKLILNFCSYTTSVVVFFLFHSHDSNGSVKIKLRRVGIFYCCCPSSSASPLSLCFIRNVFDRRSLAQFLYSSHIYIYTKKSVSITFFKNSIKSQREKNNHEKRMHRLPSDYICVLCLFGAHIFHL